MIVSLEKYDWKMPIVVFFDIIRGRVQAVGFLILVAGPVALLSVDYVHYGLLNAGQKETFQYLDFIRPEIERISRVNTSETEDPKDVTSGKDHPAAFSMSEQLLLPMILGSSPPETNRISR